MDRDDPQEAATQLSQLDNLDNKQDIIVTFLIKALTEYNTISNPRNLVDSYRKDYQFYKETGTFPICADNSSAWTQNGVWKYQVHEYMKVS
jgi:hypothetical protein